MEINDMIELLLSINLSEMDIKNRVKEKIDKMHGLINEKTALNVILKENGIDLDKQQEENENSKIYSIKEMEFLPDKTTIPNFKAKIELINYAPTKNGKMKTGLYLSDGTGKIWLNIFADDKKDFEKDVEYWIKGTYLSFFNGKPQLKKSKNGEKCEKIGEGSITHQKLDLSASNNKSLLAESNNFQSDKFSDYLKIRDPEQIKKLIEEIDYMKPDSIRGHKENLLINKLEMIAIQNLIDSIQELKNEIHNLAANIVMKK